MLRVFWKEGNEYRYGTLINFVSNPFVKGVVVPNYPSLDDFVLVPLGNLTIPEEEKKKLL